MSDSNPLDRLEANTRAQVTAWLDSLHAGIAAGPGHGAFPLSVLLLAPTMAPGSPVQWTHLCDVTVPNKPDAWAHGLYLSRDLLLLLAQMDTDFNLGMAAHLGALIAAHPLFQDALRAPATPH